MRKSIFFTIALVMSGVVFGANAATNPRASRGSNNALSAANVSNENVGGGTVVSARAATRNSAKGSNVKTTGTAVSVRSGVQQTKAPTVSARAATTQKVINVGTSVASATANTNVPQECQDAFYGCMDAFCMMDNASGGRCQCSDRIVELNNALDDILKLDEQTYLMATEGVERIQMGDAEEEIIARAKAVAEKTVNQDAEDNKKKTRTLDLSLWDNTIFNDADNVFDTISFDSTNSLADKTGDDLYKASMQMCAAQISASCQNYTSMMQLVYAQKIKSDCSAYENALKAQKSQSQQKLQAAQQALRNAALEEYQNQNKYTTTGECVIAFTRCMQTTAECGDDYTGCVTLAAQENVKGNKSGAKAKQTTIKGVVAGADITLAATTMEQLSAKKDLCEHITKQCVNSNRNDAVWKSFLRNAAPALKSAELVAEQKLRSNCIPTVAECFKNSCKSQFGDDDESYDMCLSNPDIYKSLCKVQLEPCLEATGGSYDDPTASTLWNSLVAMLNSMKVDACTKEIKDCLTSDTVCGSDYSGCVGLDTETIGDLCPAEKLTACVSNGEYVTRNQDGTINDTKLRNYIAAIAGGLALQIDNALATVCQNAVNEAMIKVCGDTESCDGMINDNLGKGTLEYHVCKITTGDTSDSITVEGGTCKDSAALVTKEELGLNTLSAETASKISSIITTKRRLNDKLLKIFIDNGIGGQLKRTNINTVIVTNYSVKPGEMSMYSPLIMGTIDWDRMLEMKDENEDDETSIQTVFACAVDDDDACKADIINSMNNTLNRIISSIESDPKVQYCKTGRKVPGFKDNFNLDGQARFPNLTDQVRKDIADAVYSKVLDNYNGKLSELESKQDKDYLELAALYKEVAAENSESEKDVLSGNACNALNRNNTEWNLKVKVTAVYSESTNVCTKTTSVTTCAKPKKANKPNKRYCKQWNDPVETTETIQM